MSQPGDEPLEDTEYRFAPRIKELDHLSSLVFMTLSCSRCQEICDVNVEATGIGKRVPVLPIIDALWRYVLNQDEEVLPELKRFDGQLKRLLPKLEISSYVLAETTSHLLIALSLACQVCRRYDKEKIVGVSACLLNAVDTYLVQVNVPHTDGSYPTEFLNSVWKMPIMLQEQAIQQEILDRLSRYQPITPQLMHDLRQEVTSIPIYPAKRGFVSQC